MYAPVLMPVFGQYFQQAIIKTENQLIYFYDSSWKYFPDTGRSKGSYIIFFQGGPIDHGTYVTVPVAQSSSEREYNAACTTLMALENIRILMNEL